MSTLEYSTSEKQDVKNDDGFKNPDMQRRAAAVRAFRDNYWSLMNRTGFGSKNTTRETIKWLNDTKLTDDTSEQKSIHWREDFIRQDGSLILREGESLYQTFTSHMSRAAPYISKASHQRWFERLYDTREQSASTSSFKMKMTWVDSELGNYVTRWKKVAEERDTLVKNSSFKDLLKSDPTLRILSDREKFLDMHYVERRGLLSKALALNQTTESMRLGLYTSAKSKLQSAADKESILSGKVGVWLERIFASKADPKKIAEFVNGSGKKSLEGLIQNWTIVKGRFDNVEKKFTERWEGTGIRGFHPVSKTKFLSMHYAQRLQYVGQAEDRLDAANDVENDAPILLKIRHEMDTEHWESAAKLIAQAKTESLSESNFTRLKSMENYVKQFSSRSEAKEQGTNIAEIQTRIDAVMADIGAHQSEVRPMAERLMRGPRADTNIHQWRWLVYNHVWCTTHGYLNQNIARKGGSKENEERTRIRSKNGDDTGRNDVIGATTSHMQAIRKREYANHSATFHHVDVTNADANNTTAEWLEHDQDPKDLYWRTYIAKDNDGPKSDNWHRDLFANLTELRSLARMMRRAGYIYTGPEGGLVNVN